MTLVFQHVHPSHEVRLHEGNSHRGARRRPPRRHVPRSPVPRPRAGAAHAAGRSRGGAAASTASLNGIELTEAQKAKFAEIQAKYQPEMQAIRESMQGGGDRAERSRRCRRSTTSCNPEIRAVLTAEQQAIFDKNLAEQKARMEQMQPGRRRRSLRLHAIAGRLDHAGWRHHVVSPRCICRRLSRMRERGILPHDDRRPSTRPAAHSTPPTSCAVSSSTSTARGSTTTPPARAARASRSSSCTGSRPPDISGPTSSR